jgi:FtsH-binding integral membrane protein
MRNNRSFGGLRYQYQTLPYGCEGNQASSLMSKVMGLLAIIFLCATVGTFIGMFLDLSVGGYFMVVIAGFIVLFVLQFLIHKLGICLFLVCLFTFLESMSLAPLVSYAVSISSNIVGQAFFMAAILFVCLSFYAWATKRDFTRMSDYLFVGVILLLVVSLIGFFFHSSLVVLAISFFGIVIFAAYVRYFVQLAHYMADTLPNAIGLTILLLLPYMDERNDR